MKKTFVSETDCDKILKSFQRLRTEMLIRSIIGTLIVGIVVGITCFYIMVFCAFSQSNANIWIKETALALFLDLCPYEMIPGKQNHFILEVFGAFEGLAIIIGVLAFLAHKFASVKVFRFLNKLLKGYREVKSLIHT